MAIKFRLDPAPTFKAKVLIPVPGTPGEHVEFTFKHRNRADFLEFVDRSSKMENVEIVMAVASGWELSEPFDVEHVTKLDDAYVGAAKAVFDTYISELSGNRLGN